MWNNAITSKMLNVNLFLKIANPFAKPKYALVIDSELVVWMKDEKEFKYIEIEKILKFLTYKLLEYRNLYDSVPFA